MPDVRSKRVNVVAHCHLDVNTKVHGLARHSGMDEVLVTRLVFEAGGIVQLPCPEATYLGLSRWGMTYEQYDTPAFRRHCRKILGPVIDTLVALADDGVTIEAVYGVDGSPSCGVAETSLGYGEGGEIEDLVAEGTLQRSSRAPGRGVFMEELEDLLAEAGLKVPFKGIDERD